jgi:hypothetical protein
MDDAELAIYREHTGRQTPPTTPGHEAWLVIGRRGGKSLLLAVIAVFIACFRDWRPLLGPGEVGTIMVIRDADAFLDVFRYSRHAALTWSK